MRLNKDLYNDYCSEDDETIYLDIMIDFEFDLAWNMEATQLWNLPHVH